MSDHRDKLQFKIRGMLERKDNKYENLKIYSNKKKERSPNESQNFCLKWTQNSDISEALDVNSKDDHDVIVISDSSSNCSSSSYKYNTTKKSVPRKKPSANNTIHIESSDSADNEIEELYQARKLKEKPKFVSPSQGREEVIRNPVQYTSDESSNGITYSKVYIKDSDQTNGNSVDSLSENMTENVLLPDNQLNNNIPNEINPSSNYASSSSSSSTAKATKCDGKPNKKLLPTNNPYNGIRKNLSRKDFRSIIKNIKSTRMVYESPQKLQENNVILNEDQNDVIHPALTPKNNLKMNNQIIDETPVDSESDVIPSSQAYATNVYRVNANQFLVEPRENENAEIECPELSERKKKQVSEWLMTTSPNASSDTSLSIVPASIKNDTSSGNSSLERLEMNYETPNNRGKIRNIPTSENRTITSVINKKVPTISRQATLNEFLKSKNDATRLYTPTNNRNDNNVPLTPTLTSAVNTPQNIDIADCADILDKLYGKSWRDKADALFPKSEPRKPAVSTINRAVQTERRPKNKGKCYTSDSDDDSDTSLKDLKLLKRDTKKNTRKNTKRDNFINDGSTGSDSDSFYYTALTNPKASINSVQKKSTVPPIIESIRRVCDDDTESEDDKRNHDQKRNIGRRRLSFSNDDIEDSSTSEFDPGDDVPPKPKTIKAPTKTPRETPKATTKTKPTIDDQKNVKQSSFLASLSESVPIANAHRDAKKYRLNFKNTKEELCNHLYKLYNEKVFDKQLPEDMSIEWNVRMRGTAGFCYNKKSITALGNVVRSSRIVLATKILDTPDRLRDTLIHEMCHAAAWLVNSVSDGHGPYWTSWAKKAMRTFPELPQIRRCHDYKIKTKFTYRCIGCGYSIGRHSKSLDTERKRCGYCYGKFELLVNRTTKSGTIQVQQTPKRELSSFALYVKENYNSIKKERNIRHGEVMKILGQQFSALKIAKRKQNPGKDLNDSS